MSVEEAWMTAQILHNVGRKKLIKGQVDERTNHLHQSDNDCLDGDEMKNKFSIAILLAAF